MAGRQGDSVPIRQGDAVSSFRTHREPIPGGSNEKSLFHTVLKEDTAPPWLALGSPDRLRVSRMQLPDALPRFQFIIKWGLLVTLRLRKRKVTL